MLNLTKFQNIFNKTLFGPIPSIFVCCSFTSSSNPIAHPSSSPAVAIFWDLYNKPPKTSPPFDAAIRLKKAVQKFGFVKYMIAYANRHSFTYVPPLICDQRIERKTLNELEKIGAIKPFGPYTCGVCGRKFFKNERLINHFKDIHELEEAKRVNQIESARGKKRVWLVAKYAMKMKKYKRAVSDVSTPKSGYGQADEVKRAGFWVREV
ncbi:zinc finger (C2H2 type) family protein [Striga hermonthica]|uniref:Zinc finger (C2H2 type) family protein n=1 Tax=Striga hermonthica TaxID=68872 RepID=A0A9N7NJG0_STRHE|nr:zinc finger (C2H2 type) family protein [Striga hermonthica]